MSKPKFNCDREWWNSLTDEEKEKWLDWAESCGSDREVNLVDRNPMYPDLQCMHSVGLGIPSEKEIYEIFEELLKDIS
jgi:hypothetical protein